MAREATGLIERLPSGSYRVSVYAGTDPLARRPMRLKATAKTETQARIELGKLLEKARDGRNPETGGTMAKLLDEYASIAQWDVHPPDQRGIHPADPQARDRAPEGAAGVR